MMVARAALLAELPPEWPDDVLPAIRTELASNGRQLVVLDDDPTGTQTVRDIAVITRWDVGMLRAELSRNAAGFYILTNSRSLTGAAARAINLELARNLQTAAAERNLPFTLASRSDSTLRGHFPLETDALQEVVGPFDLTLVTPYFDAGGRLTIGDIHYVADDDRLTPAAETPFARDPVFGFTHSNLREWIEEKTAGRIPARDVASLPLDLIRRGGPERVAEALHALPRGAHVIGNAASQRDIEVLALATLRTEAQGRRILFRTAASFVAARLGLRPGGCLTPTESTDDFTGNGGLVVVGSYVPKTTEQLARLRAAQRLCCIEVNAREILESHRSRSVIDAAARNASEALRRGENVVVYTSRELLTGDSDAATLRIGAEMSRALIGVVQAIAVRPRFLIAKGGITSSDVATMGLGVSRARVLGQLLPGVPVWELGSETRFPGLKYVIFPGNVGDADALSHAVEILDRRTHCPDA